MPAPVLQFKRGSLANLPGLRAGEPAFTTDSYDIYVGVSSETSTNKFLGSHRYWTKNTASTGSGVNLVEGTDNGTAYITIKSPDSLAGITTFVFPGSDGSNGYILTTDGSGNLSFNAPAASSFTLSADSGTNDTFSTGGTLTFSGGEGIDTAVSDDTITISAEIASTTNAGVASFTSADFSVAAGGLVSLQEERIQDIVGAMVTGNTETGITVTYQDGDGTIDFEIADAAADGTTKGIAAFDADDFDASSGVISLGDSANGAVLAINGTSNEVEVSRTNGTVTIGLPDSVTIGTSLTTPSLTIAGVAVTAILDEDSMTSDRADAIPTQQSVKAYVDTSIGNIDLTVSTSADSGTGSVSTSQTLTVSGTANEVETSASGQSITIGLPSSVTVTTALTTPTVNATNLKANDGTTSITLTDSTGAVATSSDLTIGGNLYVNGTTTQVNTTSLTVEDTIVELGLVDGSAPSSDANKDLGLLFNYYTDSAKKASVYWDDSASRMVLASEVSESSSVLTASAYAALEIGSLWVNDCAGQSQVISCADGVRKLENITIDGGTF